MTYSIEPSETESQLRFKSYSPGRIIINDHPYDKPLLLSQESILHTQAPQFSQLTPGIISEWVEHYPCELILIGSGTAACLIDESLFLESNKRGIGHAIMSTDDCIRTLVALQSEPRSIVCLLTP